VAAAHEDQLHSLEEIWRQRVANGVPGPRRINPGEFREMEPRATGVAALHSPETSIVDYRQVALAIGEYVSDLTANAVGL
jgi:L-2-hydroxyglutarate oxidase LhgO